MSAVNDGGSAFPQPYGLIVECRGMYLRDWFAGMALQGLCAQPASEFENGSDVVRIAYEAADAMLAARGQAEPDKKQDSEWSEWIEWTGGPVPYHTPGQVRLSGGSEIETESLGNLNWDIYGTDGDIIAYRFRKGGSK